jgi:hypothetical protein
MIGRSIQANPSTDRKSKREETKGADGTAGNSEGEESEAQ